MGLIASPHTGIIRPRRPPLLDAMGFGFGFGRGGRGFKKVSSGGSVFDPLTLSPTAWYKANYGGAPWADSSGNGRDATAGVAPSVGIAWNGLNPANFNGSTQYLNLPGTLGTYMSAAAFSVWFVYYINSVPADPGAGNRYLTECLLSDADAYFGLAITDSGITCEMADGIGAASSVTTAFAVDASYHFGLLAYDGTTIRIGTDNNTEATEVYGNIGATAGALKLGANYDASALIDGVLLEVGICNTNVWSSRANLRSYVNSRYALSI